MACRTNSFSTFVPHRLDGVVVEALPLCTSAVDIHVVKRRAVDGGRSRALFLVDRLVKGSRGLSSTEIAKIVRAATPRVQSVLRELKHDKRISPGGRSALCTLRRRCGHRTSGEPQRQEPLGSVRQDSLCNPVHFEISLAGGREAVGLP
jgi:hypothetical protein